MRSRSFGTNEQRYRHVRINGAAIDFRVESYDWVVCIWRYARNPFVDFLLRAYAEQIRRKIPGIVFGRGTIDL